MARGGTAANVDERRSRSAEIRKIKNTIKWMEDNGIPATHPWISLRRVTRVQDLRSSHVSLDAALKADLKSLKAEIGMLRREARRAARGRGRAADRRSRAELSEAAGAIARGNDDAGQRAMTRARERAEVVLRDMASVLSADPSSANLKMTLDQVTKVLELGGEPDRDASFDALEGVKRAMNLRLRRALRRFRRKPNAVRAGRVALLAAQSMMLGSSSGTAERACEEVEIWLKREVRRTR